jgi:hypothetical protein
LTGGRPTTSALSAFDRAQQQKLGFHELRTSAKGKARRRILLSSLVVMYLDNIYDVKNMKETRRKDYLLG